LATGTKQKTRLSAQALADELNGRKIGNFLLAVTETRPIGPRTGWLYVTVSIRNSQETVSTTPLMTAIVSGGGRGVKPWVECRLFPTIALAGDKSVNARAENLEAGVVTLLGKIIPNGGHLMIDYESGGQDETFRCHEQRACTHPQGLLSDRIEHGKKPASS
jgi:hypothetical protein